MMKQRTCGCTGAGTEIAFCARHEAAEELYAAVKALKNEVYGLVEGIFELRPVIGNTNYKVLITRCEEADAALRKADGE